MADYDFAALDQLLSRFGASDADKRDAALRSLMTFGLGMLGNSASPNKGLGGALVAAGPAGLAAQQSYRQDLNDSARQRSEAMAQAGGAMSLLEKQQAFKDRDAGREVARNYYAQSGLPGAPAGPPNATPTGLLAGFGMGDRSNGTEQPPSTPAPGAMPTAAPNGSPLAGSGPSKSTMFDQYSGLARDYAKAGLVDQARQYTELAEKFRPKVAGEPIKAVINGKRVIVTRFDDGSTSVLPFEPEPEKAHFLDIGGTVAAVDSLTGKPIAGGGLYNKTMTPGEAASNALGRDRLSWEQVQPKLENGQWVYPPNAKGGAIAKPVPGYTQPTPAALQKEIAQNNTTMSMIDTAITLGDARPKSFGLNLAGPDWVNQRMDKEGVDARAAVTNIGSQKLHDRSGAAVTITEAPRLMPFIPQVSDTWDTARKKLLGLRRETQLMQTELDAGASIDSAVAARAARAQAGGPPARPGASAVVNFADLPRGP